MLDLDSYLLLRCDAKKADKDPGFEGNLLVNRMMDSTLLLHSASEYGRIGSIGLANAAAKQLIKEGRKPYIIPVRK